MSKTSKEYLPFVAYNRTEDGDEHQWWCAAADMDWHFPGVAVDGLSSLNTIFVDDEEEAKDLADYLNRVFYAGFAHAHGMPRSAYEVWRLDWERRQREEDEKIRAYQPREGWTPSGWLRKFCRWYLLKP